MNKQKITNTEKSTARTGWLFPMLGAVKSVFSFVKLKLTIEVCLKIIIVSMAINIICTVYHIFFTLG